MKQFGRWRLIVSFGLSVGVFASVNYPKFSRVQNCWDCFSPYGVPFIFFRDGGFAGGGGSVWTGVAGNLSVVLASSVLVAWLLGRISRLLKPARKF